MYFRGLRCLRPIVLFCWLRPPSLEYPRTPKGFSGIWRHRYEKLIVTPWANSLLAHHLILGLEFRAAFWAFEFNHQMGCLPWSLADSTGFFPMPTP